MDNQHIAMWRGLVSTQKQAGKFILGPSPTAKTRLPSFNKTQSRVVTGLLAGLKILRRHLCIMGLIDSPLCRRRGAQEEISVHVLYECESLASHSYNYLGSFFLDPEDVRSLILGATWNFSKETELP